MKSKTGKTCYIEINDTLGGIVQSTPFIQELRNRFGKLIGINKNSIGDDSFSILYPLLDSICRVENAPVKTKGSAYFKTPDHQQMKLAQISEHLEWFVEHEMENEPSIQMFYQVGVSNNKPKQSYDVVIWGGACPGETPSEWPYWVELGDKLQRMGLSVAFIGKYDGAPKGTREQIGEMKFSIYPSSMKIADVGSVMKAAKKFYTGNDGGLSKYSMALGIKTFVITGPSDFRLSYNTGSALHVSSSTMKCWPCETLSSQSCNSRMCLRVQSPDFIIDNLKSIGWL